MFKFSTFEATQAFLARRQSLEKFAKEAGVSRAAVRQALAGKPITAEICAAVKALLGIDAELVPLKERR